MKAHKVGAIFYLLWGALHIIGGLAIASQKDLPAQVAMQGTAVPAEQFAGLENPVLAGILSYHGFNIAWFGVFAIAIAIIYNWRNRKTGYWMNLLVIGAIEIGLFAFMVVPSYMAFSDASIGLALFALAALFSSIGLGKSVPLASHA